MQAARHAQVQQEQATVQVQQQVFATATHLQHRAPLQQGCVTTQGPAQRLTHAQLLYARALDTVGKTQSGDFHLGQFGHGRQGFR